MALFDPAGHALAAAQQYSGRRYCGKYRSNAILAAAGYNFSLLIRWLRLLLRLVRALLGAAPTLAAA